MHLTNKMGFILLTVDPVAVCVLGLVVYSLF